MGRKVIELKSPNLKMAKYLDHFQSKIRDGSKFKTELNSGVFSDHKILSHFKI